MMNRKFSRKLLILLLVFITSIPTVLAAVPDKIQVLGITGTYADANGTYVSQGTLARSGVTYWKHESKDYYIYYDAYDADNSFWYLDVNTDDVDTNPNSNGVIAYSDNTTTTSPVGLTMYDGALANGAFFTMTIAEYSATPEINITGNGTSIVSGATTPEYVDYTNFGTALTGGGTVTRTFTIQNTGASPLSVGAISFSGNNASDFSVTTSPVSSVAGSNSTTFTVTFTPSAVGNRTAIISIVNGDSNENPYTFTISGYGFTAKNLIVSGSTTPTDANGTYIYVGIKNDFPYWKHSTLNYYLVNYPDVTGTIHNWVLDNNFLATDGYPFYCYSAANVPTGLIWLNLAFLPTGATSYSNGAGTLSVTDVATVPEINVKTGSFDITTGYTGINFYHNTNFGTLNIASGTKAKSFTIENKGTGTLTLKGTSPYVTLTGANASDFSVTTIPSNSIAAGGTTTFAITFDPSTVGTKTAVVNISSNDDDEGSYSFNIQGEGIAAKNIIVSNITTPAAANGAYTYQGISNDFQYWKNSSGYYIYNYRQSNADDSYDPIWYIDADMSVTPLNATTYNFKSLNSGDNASPSNVSSWSASSGNYGTPTIVFSEPEINIVGNSLNIVSGDNTPSEYDYTDLGWVASGSVTKTFTIQNLGTETLTLTGTSPYITIGGTNASNFSIASAPAASIAAGSSTTFQVTCTPSASLGTYSAILSIANDDGNENPYTFSIQCEKGALPTVTTQAVSVATSITATGNGNLTALGTPNPTTCGVCWNKTGSPTINDNKVDKVSTSAIGAFTAPITGLTANTTYYVRAFATNAAGTSYGSQVTFTTLPAGTWTGLANSSYWTDAGNWSDNKVPTATTNVNIPGLPIGGYLPMIFPGDAADCNNLTTSPGFLETLSSSSGYGSLIVHGTATGKIYTNVYLTGNQWHIVAPPSDGFDISSFVGYNTLSDISHKVDGATTTYAIADYNENGNTWNSCFTNNTSGSFALGKGYSMHLDNSSWVSFYGDIVTGTKTVSLTKTGTEERKGWNCIGNPYTSAININATSDNNSFLYNNIVSNTGILDDNYNAIYTWDAGSGHYKTICRENFDSYFTQNYAKQGEGFFVKAAKDGAKITFTRDMQTHTTTATSTSSWPTIAVKLANSSNSATTVVAFNSAMTAGLDKGYDAGFLADSSEINIYSRLVNDNGVDFAIQSLPVSSNDQIVPLTVESKNGGTITFSAKTANLTSSIYAILEDNVTGTLTDLKGGQTYSITVAAGAVLTNRFYLHTSKILPAAVTDSASAISANTATLNGTVNANNATTVVTFDYGTSTSYGLSATATQSPVSGTSSTPVSSSISDLTPNTMYHFRVKAVSTEGTTYGADEAFTTITVPDAPTIGTATAGVSQVSVSFTAPTFNGRSVITGYTIVSSPGGYTASGTSSPITVSGLTNGTAYTFTVTATNIAGTSVASAASNSVTPNMTQTITFANPSTQTFGTSPTLSATATSGLAVVFSTTTPDVCSITTGGTLTFKKAGTCTILAGQIGNGTYSAAPTVSRSFTVNAIVPGVPTIGTATSGNAQTTVNFTAPTSDGGSPITSYTVTSSPGNLTGTGTSSPIIVSGLTNGTTYTFTVTATNIAGTSAPSAASNSVTPFTSPTATTLTASVITASTATLNGTVTANGASTLVSFEYGLTTNYGTTITANQSPVTGANTISVSKAITGLTSNTAYHYRIAAVNAAGTTYGIDQTFSTSVTTGLDTPEAVLTLYPNPASDGFYIHAGEAITLLSISDLSGRIVLVQQVTGNSYINISSLQKGAYVVKVNGSVAKLVKK